MSTDENSWPAPPEKLLVSHESVHVWRAFLNSTSVAERLIPLLNSVEIQRAESFYFARDRTRYINGHGVLRDILSRYTDRAPQALRFDYAEYGKPYLAKGYGADGLRFNMSHSHEVGLYAVTLHREVGVDVEHMRADFAREEVAERFFSRAEVEALRTLPAHLRTDGFFNCWTRKEAYIKAIGEGLNFPLDQFTVSLEPGETAMLLDVAGKPQEATRWSMQQLFPQAGYAAALAVEGVGWQIERWGWTVQSRSRND
ncbi:MAG: 4'-phosphopantetheinyl transferase superfamily protein [Pyrinomonadaceae bacterium]